MQISLTKNSDVPLRQQLAEQIVFLITTGQLCAGEELPSVRALARQVRVHHNTVSEAYQDLVRRNWLSRKRGSRLTVGINSASNLQAQPSLDELINESIQRARDMGYSLQALRQRVRERLLAQPPDHILVVEEESGLREIIRREVRKQISWPVETCSWQQFTQEPGLAIGAQVFAPAHIINELKPFVSQDRPPLSIAYSRVDEQIDLIRNLKNPSIVAVASVSESLLRTARSLFAPSLARNHTFKELLLSGSERIDMRGVDLVFCDSLAISLVNSPKKVHYRLIEPNCLEHLHNALNLERPSTEVSRQNRPSQNGTTVRK